MQGCTNGLRTRNGPNQFVQICSSASQLFTQVDVAGIAQENPVMAYDSLSFRPILAKQITDGFAVTGGEISILDNSMHADSGYIYCYASTADLPYVFLKIDIASMSISAYASGLGEGIDASCIGGDYYAVLRSDTQNNRLTVFNKSDLSQRFNVVLSGTDTVDGLYDGWRCFSDSDDNIRVIGTDTALGTENLMVYSSDDGAFISSQDSDISFIRHYTAKWGDNIVMYGGGYIRVFDEDGVLIDEFDIISTYPSGFDVSSNGGFNQISTSSDLLYIRFERTNRTAFIHQYSLTDGSLLGVIKN